MTTSIALKTAVALLVPVWDDVSVGSLAKHNEFFKVTLSKFDNFVNRIRSVLFRFISDLDFDQISSVAA